MLVSKVTQLKHQTTTNISLLNVYSVPTKSTCLQNTYDDDDSTCSCIPITAKSPSLKNVIFTKKSTSFRFSRKSIKNENRHTAGHNDYLNDLMNASSVVLSPSSADISYDDSLSSSSFDTFFSNDLDHNSLYSNPRSFLTTSSITADFDHPLAKTELPNEFSLLSKNENENVNENENDSENDLFDSLKSKISVFLNSKFIFRSNNSMPKSQSEKISHSNNITDNDLIDKDLILNDAVPLETFKTILKPIIMNEEEILTNSDGFPIYPKSRECRINSQFLRFYSIDLSVKNNYSNQLLSQEVIDFYENQFLNSGFQNIDHFLRSAHVSKCDFNLIKFQLLSRDKLYSNVILQPRNDIIGDKQHHYAKKYDRNLAIKDGSVIRENGKKLPWLLSDDQPCFKPTGKLSNNIQYTVKNWENSRWSTGDQACN